MNYQKHYDLLIKSRLKIIKYRKMEYINRSKLYNIDKFLIPLYHRHHIIPKCINGSDEDSNIIFLTPKEHFVAHILLAKIYKDSNLIYAVWRMTHGKTGMVINSSNYEWLCKSYSITHSANLKGKKRKPFSEKHKSNISKSLKNKKLSEEHKRNIGLGGKGIKKPCSEKHKRNISKNHGNKGIMPWKTSSVINNNLEYNWSQLDKIYDIWIKNSKPGYGILSRISINKDSNLIKSSSFNSMIKWFLRYGDPRKHSMWLQFKYS